MSLSDVKPSMLSLLTVTLMVIVGVPAAKWLMIKFPVPGLADLVGAI